MSSSKKKTAASPMDDQEAFPEENAVTSEENSGKEATSSDNEQQSSSDPSATTSASGAGAQSSQPIPPPSDARQFRAIGLLQGVYVPSEEQFNRGELVTREGLRLDAVLLGQVMSLVKKYIDLALPHLWVVYPRTREAEPMHVQLVGVWSPDGFDVDEERTDAGEEDLVSASLSPLESLKPPLKDGFFSIRGQVIQQNPENSELLVKIQQTSRKKNKTAKAFKLKLSGEIAQKPMGYFWDFEVVRDGEHLKVEKATPVAFMPMKRKKRVGGPPRRQPRGDAPPRKPIKKSVPLGQELGKSAPQPVVLPKVQKRDSPSPERPLPQKIIKSQDADDAES